MLRLLVLMLLLLNGVYFAYTHGLLRPYGFAPAQQTEPHRVAQQIRPELVRILSADETRALEAAARAGPKPAECLLAGPFDDAQAEAVRDAAQANLPPGSWSLDAVVEPARWIVYMGRFQDAQALAKKRAELASLNLRFEPLTNRSLEFGLSLGGYDTEASARTELAALSQRGVRTATVVQERPEVRASRLRIQAVDAAILPKLDELKGALDGKPLRPCK